MSVQDPNNPANASPNVLSIAIKDQNVLYATYMSFIKPDGGLFIPTRKEFKPSDKLSLIMALLDKGKFEITARVVWVTPKGVHGARAPGVGVQFEGSKAKDLNTEIKQILGLELQRDLSTYTM